MVDKFTGASTKSQNWKNSDLSYNMANIDEELQMDAEEDAREVEFIKNQLPSELRDEIQ